MASNPLPPRKTRTKAGETRADTGATKARMQAPNKAIPTAVNVFICFFFFLSPSFGDKKKSITKKHRASQKAQKKKKSL
jgi:hypothetical protein